MSQQARRAAGPPDLPPKAALIVNINRYRMTQVVYVVARYGIADLLASGPKSAEELAPACASHAGALYRLLRAAAGMGIFRQDETGKFENTPLSEALRSDSQPSFRPAALLMGEDWHWSMWGDLLNTVKTGMPAFPRLFGCDLRAYLAQHPEASSVFRANMEALLMLDTLAVFSLYDFSVCRTLLYLGFGGGYVGFLTHYLKRYPEGQVNLIEFPELAATARDDLDRAGILDRCRVVVREPLSPLPLGADTHVFRYVIADHGDEEAVQILRNSHQALQDGGRLLLIGTIIPPTNEAGLGKLIDLEAMLVDSHARERTEREFRELLAQAGFRINRVLSGRSPTSVIEAVKN